MWFFFVDPQVQDRVSTFCFELSSTVCCSSGGAADGVDDAVAVAGSASPICSAVAAALGMAAVVLGAIVNVCARKQHPREPEFNDFELPRAPCTKAPEAVPTANYAY